MNEGISDHTGGRNRQRRARLWHAAMLATAAAGVAFLTAACGGGGSTGGSTAYQTSNQKELAYAQCMRTHGLPSFPDPTSNGTFTSTKANANDFSGPRFASADKTCGHLEGPPESAAQFQQNVSQALKLAACMHAHGITNFQANVQGDRIAIGINGPAADMNSPQFVSAQRACRKLLPGGQ